MNFYLGLLDRFEKHEDENPSIGIILCADKDQMDVEISLQDINKPIAVSDYQLLLPTKELQALILEELKNAYLRPSPNFIIDPAQGLLLQNRFFMT